MSTANKLTYLNGTKTALKDTINMSNAGITNETTFRDYAKKLRNGYIDIINNGTDDLYNNMPHLTGKSKELSLSPSYEAPMKITCYGDTTQYTTTGKNLLIHNSTYSAGTGITFTENDDGSIKASGTATDTNYKRICETIHLPAGTYTVSGGYAGTNSGIAVQLRNSSGFTTYYITDSSGKKTFTIPEGDYIAFCQIRINEGWNGTYTFFPMIESGSTATSYEPYTGGIPAPNPDFPQDIEVVKGYSNLLPTNIETIESSGLTFTRLSDGSYKINGTSNANHTFELYTDDSITIPAGTYTGNIGNRTNIVDGYIRLDNGDYQTIFSNTNDTNTFTINSSFTFNRFYIYITTGKTFNNQIIKPMLNEGNTPLYFVPYGSNYAYTKITGKNLFNKNNIETGKYYITTRTDTSPNWAISQVEVLPNTTYYLSGNNYNNTSAYIVLLDNDKNVISSVGNYYNTHLITTNSNTKYIGLSIANYSGNSDLNTIQLEKGTTATTYEAYNGTEYVIKLGTTKLCKIGDYEDKIFKNETTSTYYDNTLDLNEWYINKKIGKVVLDGSEDWETIWNDNTNILHGWNVGLSNGMIYPESLDIKNPLMSDNFTVFTQNGLYGNQGSGKSGIAGRRNTNKIIISYNDITTLADFKTWLSTHNTEVYYVLETPTYTKITDSETISQLEALKSKNGTTNITSDMVLDVIVLKNE